MATTTTSESRWVPVTERHDLEVPAIGGVSVTVSERDRVQPFLLLHGGAGPASVTAFGDLLAARQHLRVIMPTHPGFDGTDRPPSLRTVRDLARLYAALLDDLDVWDVTVLGNSVGGWVAAELALVGSPRVSGAILVDAVGADVPGHPVTDVSGLSPTDLVALSFHDPERFAPDPGAPGPSPSLVAADLATLAIYGGSSMSDPTLLERLAELDLPVHVIWGDADRVVTPEYGRAVASAIPGSHFTLLPGAGHLPQVEAPEQLLGAIWDLGDDRTARAPTDSRGAA